MASVRSIPRISALLSYARIVSCAPSIECIRQEIVVSIFTSVAIYSSFRLPHPIGTNSSLITIFPVQVTRGAMDTWEGNLSAKIIFCQWIKYLVRVQIGEPTTTRMLNVCFTFRTDDQLISITLATSPRHSEHKPTSNKSPALTAPEKLLIVTSWRHFPHQTLESNCFFVSLGMVAHNFAAGAVNLGMDSMVIS